MTEIRVVVVFVVCIVLIVVIVVGVEGANKRSAQMLCKVRRIRVGFGENTSNAFSYLLLKNHK